MTKEVQRGVEAKLPVRVLNTEDKPFSPVGANAPAITRVLVNGQDATDTVAASIGAQLGGDGEAVTGHYNITVATAGLQYNDQVQVYATATVEGVPLEVLKEFTVSSDSSRMPKMI
jgi:hypothetical protein